MANDKKQDGLFHWNFDLQETDSDFTDIDFSADAIHVPSNGEDAEIKPMIFVDGNYKSGQEIDYGEEYYEEETPRRIARKGHSDRKESFSERFSFLKGKNRQSDYYEDQEKFSGGRKDIPWKPIAIIGGLALLTIIGLILLFAGRDNRKKEWARNEDAKIEQLVADYFKAKTDANSTAMEKILVQEVPVNSLQMIMEAKAYESYTNIQTYAYPGLKKSETALFVTYDSKFKNIDTVLPTIAWFYTKQDKEGNLRLMPVIYEQGAKSQSKEYDYILGTYDGSPVQQLAEEKKSANTKAVNSDPDLAKYLDQIAKGNYETYVPETTTTEPPTPYTEPTTVTEPPTTAYIPSLPIGYITDDSVRMRSSMDTTDLNNVISVLEAGHALEIIEVLDGWVHVRDWMTQNRAGGTQTPSMQDGYVYAEFFKQGE